ncbi:MAG: aconitase family protein, partial [Gammaproteobacteria bacterium]|nr:aconitase family protein [Gammaproteobacteria bacterium]
LGFQTVGYGCTTCIGNSGPLEPAIGEAIRSGDLVACSVLSGNRNFEGRIHPQVRANYLASPPLVVAYALAGSMRLDLHDDPIGEDTDGNPVYLQEIWPTPTDIEEARRRSTDPGIFRERYADVFTGPPEWQAIEVEESQTYAWKDSSTYVKNPPYFTDMNKEPSDISAIEGARVLALLGDSVTTDHISPAGSIPPDGPAGRYLIDQGVEQADFNSFGSRRGNHEVMMRGTFANVRLRNEMAPGTSGGITVHQPSGEQMSIYDAAMRYAEEGVPLVVVAGKEYGTGSSRDWAAKGTNLLGVRAVIAESYERIHRSNLVGMGVLPLQFPDGVDRGSLGLDGSETFAIDGVAGLEPGALLTCRITRADGSEETLELLCRVDTADELDYFRNGGILPYVLRQLLED